MKRFVKLSTDERGVASSSNKRTPSIMRGAPSFVAELGMVSGPRKSVGQNEVGSRHRCSTLGIDWSLPQTSFDCFEFPYVTIESIAEEGLVQAWNKNNPDRQIVEGSRIIEVNYDHINSYHLSLDLHSEGHKRIRVISKATLDRLAKSHKEKLARSRAA